MPAKKSASNNVPFQTQTRRAHAATQTPAVTPGTRASTTGSPRGASSSTPNRRRGGQVTRAASPTPPVVARVPPLVSPARERAESILARHRPPLPQTMADQAALIQALQALTVQLDQGRAAAAQQQQQLVNQNLNLVDILNQQINNPPVHNPNPHIPDLLVETIPKFEGSNTDFPQDFVDHVARLAVAEGWNDQQSIQVASRRLAKTALDWHVHSGHNHATWVLWSAALVNNFSPRIPYGVWMSQVQERRQRPGESGIEYALEKRKLLRLAPVPLNDAQTVAFLINGLAKWQHEGAMSANLPANFDAFLTRMRELEAMDVSAGPVYPVAAPVAAAAGALNPFVPPFGPPPVPPPVTVPPFDLNRTLAAFGDKLMADIEARFGGAAGGRGLGAPAFGRGRGGAPRPDPRICYVCRRAGHIAKFCPDRT